MQEQETIESMYKRFTVIMNELSDLGKKHTTHQKIKKILKSLPKIWRPKITAI
uniref:Uncharacterized protein n=1 Tax=Cajanus cajan TaxID=3821 RepID=A0A151TF60_CAJCA|nr:hypothetical protein KK1_011921 [Cajanus cajan]